MNKPWRMPTPFDPAASYRPRPGLRTAAIALLGNSLCIAVAETIIGPLDQTDNYAGMAASPGRLEAGGLLHLLCAVLLGVAVAGLARVVWASVTGRVATVLLAVAVPCGGAFAMFHLVLVETVAEGLDPVAMEEFVVERATGPGAWGMPVAYYALVGFVASMLLLVALARVGVVTWIAPGIVLVAILMELSLGDGMTEIAAHWLDVAAWVIAAVGIWRIAGRASATVRTPVDSQRTPVWQGVAEGSRPRDA